MNLTPEVISAIDRLCDLAEHGGGHPLDKEAAELVRRELNVKKRSDSYQGMSPDLRTATRPRAGTTPAVRALIHVWLCASEMSRAWRL